MLEIAYVLTSGLSPARPCEISNHFTGQLFLETWSQVSVFTLRDAIKRFSIAASALIHTLIFTTPETRWRRRCSGLWCIHMNQKQLQPQVILHLWNCTWVSTCYFLFLSQIYLQPLSLLVVLAAVPRCPWQALVLKPGLARRPMNSFSKLIHPLPGRRISDLPVSFQTQGCAAT